MERVARHLRDTVMPQLRAYEQLQARRQEEGRDRTAAGGDRVTSASWAFLLDSVPFTKAVVDGETSLGGSESACLGLARALKARGHDVHVFATKLAADAGGADAAGRRVAPARDFADEPVHRVGRRRRLRMISFFNNPIQARLRLLWNQDLLPGGVGQQVMAIAWALDKSVYVSEYHRQQWEACSRSSRRSAGRRRTASTRARAGAGHEGSERASSTSAARSAASRRCSRCGRRCARACRTRRCRSAATPRCTTARARTSARCASRSTRRSRA
jgi:hypothetical protein